MKAYCALIREKLFDDMDDMEYVYCYHAECSGRCKTCPYCVEDVTQLENVENKEDLEMDECRNDVLVVDEAVMKLLERARLAIQVVMEECELPRGKDVKFADEEIVLQALKSYCENLEA